MEVFEVIPKRWGNSLGITIPNEIVRKEHITPKNRIKVIVLTPKQDVFDKVFGTLKRKKPTQQIMKEIDEGYD